jgi:protein gp37
VAENSAIEWTDHTFNPWIGCTRVSPGCDNCYAARQDKFRGWTPEGWGGPRRRTKTWGDPKRWNGQHATFYAAHGRRQRVFCASLADVFDNQVPIQWRRDLFDLIELTPHLDWLLLTKRVGNVADMVREARTWDWLLGRSNVWLGATVVNQEEADRDIPKLLATPVRVRFLSMEPLLGPVDLTGEWLTAKLGAYPFKGLPAEHRTRLVDLLDWVIAGGESGPGARPAHPDWFRSLRDQCAAAGTAFLFKQWGDWSPGYAEHGNDLGYEAIVCAKQHEWPEGHCSFHVGKKAAGRLLDGVTHEGFPAC